MSFSFLSMIAKKFGRKLDLEFLFILLRESLKVELSFIVSTFFTNYVSETALPFNFSQSLSGLTSKFVCQDPSTTFKFTPISFEK